MQEKYLKYYNELKASIQRVLDDIYDMLDATEQAGISDSRTETLKKVADKYEELLKRFRNKEEMTDFEQAEILIIVNQVITSMESQRTKLTKAINGMKDIKLKLWKVYKFTLKNLIFLWIYGIIYIVVKESHRKIKKLFKKNFGGKQNDRQ